MARSQPIGQNQANGCEQEKNKHILCIKGLFTYDVSQNWGFADHPPPLSAKIRNWPNPPPPLSENGEPPFAPSQKSYFVALKFIKIKFTFKKKFFILKKVNMCKVIK